MKNRTLILIDGENILHRFEAMLKEGRTKSTATLHHQGLFVWHPNISEHQLMDIMRVSYYTTFVGDNPALKDAEQKIASIAYAFRDGKAEARGHGRLCPHIFKKDKHNQESKSVDINLTIDALRHTYNDTIDTLYLFSGDGDYIPLIREVMRQGKKVIVGALSSGLSPSLKTVADGFINLDDWLLTA